jgi:pilus assembly protein CpaF
MRPDRIVVGECRGGEALDMLQAMNTGHDGSLTTIHANNPRDCMARLETLVLMAGMDLPLKAIRQQISSAINLIVQLNRLKDGSRKVTSISEIIGMEGETITMQDIFILEQKGATPDGKVIAEFKPTGLRPKILDRMFSQGIPLPKEILTLFPPPPGYKPATH